MERLNPQVMVTLWNIERLGSFSAVARETGWSQPAISQQIKKCEDELKIPLVRRTSHGVELTPVGLILSKHGQLIDNRLTQAQRDIDAYGRHHSAHIRLIAPPSICSSFAARALVHMSWSSEVRVGLMQMEPPEAVDALSQGLADCAVTFQYHSIPEFVKMNEDLETEYFGSDPLLLLVNQNSVIAKRYAAVHEPISLSVAKDEHWIAGCETCQANLISLARVAGFSPDITHSTDDYWATQNLVEMGMGVSIVPRISVRAHLENDLMACPIKDENACREVLFVTRKGDHRPALLKVKDEIKRAAQKYLE
ncbi:transcriptional regulator [Bifidobacterium lemurum]|uniref:Transcriptional regulator n=1 Tax=Bifidobacterium lemurum TaxID=1603886 RepID=A0A261FRI7_9BIFI|nr:LysR family transcriptional regulator [Bifidobacterium lemurum]OZG61800.1 transcriptional regulator [Bifidobacterium lemurum]QOL34949.1 LysR family transcriptional regulator [Bifidobacterium lemurum]